MPNTRDPVTVAAPALPTGRSSTITPLLSELKSVTGLATCWARVAVDAPQVLVEGQL